MKKSVGRNMVMRGASLRKSRKANMMTQFLVLMIIAVIMILLVTTFGKTIWEAFFPSGDKASVKSFEMMHSLIDSKSVSKKPYDSSKITLFMENDYQMILFDDKPQFTCTESNIIMRPSKCKDATKPCLCLYDDPPEKKLNADNKDENVVMCKSFKNGFTFNDTSYLAFEINKQNCERKDGKFFNMMVAHQITQKGSHIFVWVDNETNRKIDAELRKISCPNTNGLCQGKKDGDLLSGHEYFKNVSDFCKTNSSILTAEATCAYDPIINTCNVQCSKPSIDCNLIKSCEDYNKMLFMNAEFMTQNTATSFYCINDICNVTKGKGCTAASSAHYASRTLDGQSDRSDANKKKFVDYCTRTFKNYGFDYVTDFRAECGSCYFKDLKDSIQSYKAEYTKQDKIYVCAGMFGADSKTTSQNIQSCAATLKPFKDNCNAKIWEKDFKYLAYYDSSNSACFIDASRKLEDLYFCTGPKVDFSVDYLGLSDVSINDGTCKEIVKGEYNCVKGKSVRLKFGVKNTGAVPITLAAKPRITRNDVAMAYYPYGDVTTVNETVGTEINATIDLDTGTVPYVIYASAECQDTNCKKQLSEFAYKTTCNNIVLNLVDSLN